MASKVEEKTVQKGYKGLAPLVFKSIDPLEPGDSRVGGPLTGTFKAVIPDYDVFIWLREMAVVCHDHLKKGYKHDYSMNKPLTSCKRRIMIKGLRPKVREVLVKISSLKEGSEQLGIISSDISLLIAGDNVQEGLYAYFNEEHLEKMVEIFFKIMMCD
jgi:hypothetical protein